ncbi:hypothetical protein [Actinocrispum wychmicini]|uniref:Uncharacterized protein n=1 Tax=Actinocrispum wychmicini TaxID=1213861 RepID=A0A4R2IHJ2_9PSEU|nr:hypothetical protein [Actinocrispum wychmicini]TCO44253.1 hypothetical protein EV192_12426 [Actinocrispum wychmicini]
MVHPQQAREAHRLFKVSKVMFALGGLALLITVGGLFMALGADHGAKNAPGTADLVIASFVAVALISGATATRNAAARRMMFRATKPFDPMAAFVLWGGLVGLLGIAWLIGFALHARVGLVVLLAFPPLMVWHQKRMTAVQVDPVGVTIGESVVRWPDVAQLVVTDPGPGHDIQVGALPRPGCPLVAGIVVPRGQFDLARLTAMVRQYGPGDVAVITN